MDAALIGLAGIVVGTLLGGTGRYWLLRRDLWREARTSGLLLLADVRALREAQATARVVSDTKLGVSSWESHRKVLAEFRRGSFPNGFKAPEWLELAVHFAHLREFSITDEPEGDGDSWSRAQNELAAAERLLARFEEDPPVLGYVLRAPLKALSGRRSG
jgi:hypothetical protein